MTEKKGALETVTGQVITIRLLDDRETVPVLLLKMQDTRDVNLPITEIVVLPSFDEIVLEWLPFGIRSPDGVKQYGRISIKCWRIGSLLYSTEAQLYDATKHQFRDLEVK